jgi:hypothetical protein
MKTRFQSLGFHIQLVPLRRGAVAGSGARRRPGTCIDTLVVTRIIKAVINLRFETEIYDPRNSVVCGEKCFQPFM